MARGNALEPLELDVFEYTARRLVLTAGDALGLLLLEAVVGLLDRAGDVAPREWIGREQRPEKQAQKPTHCHLAW
jgi:hypothetical protein